MAEDFTSYTEVDPNTRITVTASKVTWASLSRDEDAYVYSDKGIGYFDGDFTHLLTYRSNSGGTGGTSVIQFWALTNLLDDWQGIATASGDALVIASTGGATPYIRVEECDGGSTYASSPYTLSVGTSYYLKVVRDESEGTHGTLYCYIYSNSARTTLLETLSLALHSSKKDFRYVHAILSRNTGESNVTHSGYTENLTLYGVSGGHLYPSEATTRVTSLIHRYDRGTYTLEILLGEVVSDFGLPEWDSKARTAVPETLEEAIARAERAFAESPEAQRIDRMEKIMMEMEKALPQPSEIPSEVAGRLAEAEAKEKIRREREEEEARRERLLKITPGI